MIQTDFSTKPGPGIDPWVEMTEGVVLNPESRPHGLRGVESKNLYGSSLHTAGMTRVGLFVDNSG